MPYVTLRIETVTECVVYVNSEDRRDLGTPDDEWGDIAIAKLNELGDDAGAEHFVTCSKTPIGISEDTPGEK